MVNVLLYFMLWLKEYYEQQNSVVNDTTTTTTKRQHTCCCCCWVVPGTEILRTTPVDLSTEEPKANFWHEPRPRWIFSLLGFLSWHSLVDKRLFQEGEECEGVLTTGAVQSTLEANNQAVDFSLTRSILGRTSELARAGSEQ